MYNRTYREIDLKAIEHNFTLLSRKVAEGVKKCAVIKADAYGHGAVPVAKVLEKKADYFAVACFDEAVELREAGITIPVLVLSYICPDYFGEAVERDITATVYTLDDALKLNRAAEEKAKRAKVHIALDTGMSRIGFPLTDASAEIIRRIADLPFIELEGIFSHFAKADMEDDCFSDEQRRLFDAFLVGLSERGVSIPLPHLYNTAGVFRFENRYPMVRMGIAIYGINPMDYPTQDEGLLPAMEVKTHVIHVHEVSEGEGISYGHTYVAKGKRKIATLSVGYADGFRRVLSNKGYVLIRGERAYVTGKVCMDLVMVDVTDIEGVTVGDEAVIIGKSGEREITANDYGKMYGSFAYEALCTFSPRAKKIYK
ncbi:MAG: alanine racemase [Clostridia bacterium]|nr:alanine racemase [Clostridia bacterium]